MKIFEHSNTDREYPHNFEYVFTIYATNDEDLENAIETMQDPFGYWLQDNTEDNYIFLRHASKIVGGGYGGNSEQSYILCRDDPSDLSHENVFDHLEIRMSKRDAVKFKLWWC